MPARFRIYDNGEQGERFTIIDSKAISSHRQNYYSFFGFSENPYHPCGIGMHGELTAGEYMVCAMNRFRHWGKRIAGKDLPEQAQRSIKNFMKECEGSKASIHTAITLYAKDKP